MKKISIIIPTFNESKKIKNILEDIKKQTYKKYEIIIVDENSKDETVKIAKRYGARILFSNKRSLSHARNKGIKNSNGDIIINLDADFRINRKFLEEIVKIFNEEEISGLKVRENLIQDTLTERIDYLRSFYKHGGYTLTVRVIKKGILYDEELTNFGEDIHIEKKIKGKIGLCKGAIISHHRFHSFRDVIKSWKVYPSCFIYYLRYEKKSSLLKGLIPLSYPFISPFIAIHRLIKFRDPIALLIPIYDLARFYGYIIGIPKYYLKRFL